MYPLSSLHCYVLAILRQAVKSFIVSVVCSATVPYIVYYLYRHIYYKMYTFSELSDIHFYYGAADDNSTKTQLLCGEKYLNRTIPSGYQYLKTHEMYARTFKKKKFLQMDESKNPRQFQFPREDIIY